MEDKKCLNCNKEIRHIYYCDIPCYRKCETRQKETKICDIHIDWKAIAAVIVGIIFLWKK